MTIYIPLPIYIFVHMLLKLLLLLATALQYFANYYFRDFSARANTATYLTPPGYVFSIWGLIYSLQIAQLCISFKYEESKAKLYFAAQTLCSLLNALWLWAFNDVANRLAQLAVILALYLALAQSLFVQRKMGRNFVSTLYVSLYYGWISQASILSLLIYLDASPKAQKALSHVLVICSLGVNIVLS